MEGSNRSTRVRGRGSRANPVKDEVPVMQMSKEERASLTVGDIRSESLKMLRGNSSSFLCIQLTLVLPCIILTICFCFLLSSYVPAEYAELFMGQPYQTDAPLAMNWNTLLQLLPFIVMGIIGSVVLLGFYALAVSANIYAVVLIFTDKAVSYASVLKGAIPRLWVRLFVTLLCWLILLWPMLLLFTGIHVSVMWIRSVMRAELPMPVPSPVVFILDIVRRILFIYIIIFGGMTFMLVSGVCVFEENYGFAPLRRARQLTIGKETEAKGIHLRAFLVEFVVFFLVVGSGFVVEVCQYIQVHPWTFLLVMAGVGWVTYDVEMACVSAGVTYVSFKAYQDAFEESLLQDEDDGEYQPVSDGIEP